MRNAETPWRTWLLGMLVAALAPSCAASPPPAPPVLPAPIPGDLRAPEAFALIADPSDRSRAIFQEASRVLLHPRCANCHPASDAPTQRDFELHDPPVVRGEHDRGVPGMECGTCHQDRNAELARVPGAPKWQLAPRVMAWVGKSPHDVCEQLKDPARNGGRGPAAIIEHAAHDPIVAWGWQPGADREPAPGTQSKFAALVAAWIATGEACPAGPNEERR